MYVINNKQKFFVGWQYDDPQHPFLTKCILKDVDTKQILKVTSVKKYHTDTCSKEKARMFSLKKLVDALAPNVPPSVEEKQADGSVKLKYSPEEEAQNIEQKAKRTAFWKAYLNRGKKTSETVSFNEALPV